MIQVHGKKADHIALALGDAYNAGILHRDFSPGNVIILGDGSGWLIDWDLSKPVKLRKATPRCATRTVCFNILLRVLIKVNMFGIGYMAIHVC
jgi:predicted Ser/Thr protein kinase